MLVNETNILEFNAKLLKVEIETQELNNSSEWVLGALSPIYIENKKTFKKITLELAFKGDSRDIILKNISNFMSKLITDVELTLDGYSNKYRCILSSSITEKTVSKHIYKKELTFMGFEYGTQVIETMDRITSKTINVSGNTETPAIVEITPSIGLIDLILTGVSDDSITIKNLVADKKIIIDGESCKVTVDGINKFQDTEMWGFPKLLPGSRTITVDKDSVDITIKYKPRFI